MDIIERLRHAATTASNDDYSKPQTTERDRHVERVDAMLAGADEIERLRGAIKDCADGGPCAKCATRVDIKSPGERT